VTVTVQSGAELSVSFVEQNGVFSSVELTGPADFVFEGTMEL
jgi:hypothetical protein